MKRTVKNLVKAFFVGAGVGVAGSLLSPPKAVFTMAKDLVGKTRRHTAQIETDADQPAAASDEASDMPDPSGSAGK